MSDVRAEMSSTILDIKDFLKNINATKDTKVVRQIIDNFREQMKRHSDKFISLRSGKLNKIHDDIKNNDKNNGNT
jgi:hypothetical protein